MKTAPYLASLLPSFGKQEVLEDCRITRIEIKEVTEPSYETAAALFRNWKFKSAALKDRLSTFDRMVKIAGNDNAIVKISKSFKGILENLDEVEKLIDKTYNEEVAGAGFTYLKANLLQFVECVSFVSKFSRKFLNYVYICETAEFEEQGQQYIKESLTPAEVEWLNANFVAFCSAMNVVTTQTSTFKRAIDGIPDIVVTNENAGTMGATVGEAKLDPFQMKFIPVWLNPIYHVGMFIAEWQASRYKASQEELRLLQLRRLNLERMAEGKPDAKLQSQIVYMESRIQSLNYKISKMEAANA